jgi:hypothetical protein
MWRLVLLSDQIQSENINFIKITKVPLPLCGPGMLHYEEVSSPKTINIKQYLSTRHFLVDNIYVVIKSSQTTQLYNLSKTKTIKY